MDGPELQFERVHEEFRTRIHRYLARLAGTHEAEDLTQEVFAKVAKALPGFRGDCRLSTWIYRIASHAAFDRKRGSALRVTEPLTMDAPDPSGSADVEASRQEMGGCVREFVDRLPMEYRAVVILSDVEGLTDREIAAVLGTTTGAVKIRLHRARARLRRSLEEGCRLSRDADDEFACEPKLVRILSRPTTVDKVGRDGRGA